MVFFERPLAESHLDPLGLDPAQRAGELSGGQRARVIADPDMDEATRADMVKWTGCIAGALTSDEFARALNDAGLVDVDIRETHRVHPQAASAIIRATKPSAEVELAEVKSG